MKEVVEVWWSFITRLLRTFRRDSGPRVYDMDDFVSSSVVVLGSDTSRLRTGGASATKDPPYMPGQKIGS